MTNSFVPICTIHVPANSDVFKASVWFLINTSHGGVVTICGMDTDFREGFLEGDGLVEKSTVATILKCSRLPRELNYQGIVTELGGEAMAESYLFQLFWQMEQQPNGEQGTLSVNGQWNIRFVRNLKEILCAVCVRWHNNGWDIDAGAIECPPGSPNTGHLVFHP